MQYGVLSGSEILRTIKTGEIVIDPFEVDNIKYEDRINSASYDLTLGPHVAVYSSVVTADWGCRIGGVPGERVRVDCQHLKLPPVPCLDAAQENPVERYEMDSRGFMLMPGIGYLMHTVERIATNKYIPIIDGKSSIGRLFCFVHVTAGLGDPGFDGQYTLEVLVTHPLIVYPGMRFCQIRFFTIVGEAQNYQKAGHYTGKLAIGPVPSRSWTQFSVHENNHK
jgi:dCTP deaminase